MDVNLFYLQRSTLQDQTKERAFWNTPEKCRQSFIAGTMEWWGIGATNEPAKSGSCAMRVARCAA